MGSVVATGYWLECQVHCGLQLCGQIQVHRFLLGVEFAYELLVWIDLLECIDLLTCIG